MRKIVILAMLFFASPLLSNTLRLVEYATNNAADEVCLELGSLTFYFDDTPLVHFVPDIKNLSHHRYIFPQVQKAKEVGTSSKKISDEIAYEVAAQSLASVNGVQAVLYFDDATIKVSHAAYDAPDGRKGIRFYFFNKKLLNQLQHQGNPILNTACIQ